jgi:hypothetical protein
MAETQIHSLSVDNYPPLSDEQLKARWRFLKNFYNASLYLVLLSAFIILFTAFLDFVNHQLASWLYIGLTGVAITGTLAILYITALITIIWKRTGLKWYVIGENLQGLNLLVLALFWFIYFVVLPLEVRYSTVAIVLALVGIGTLNWALRRLFGQQVRLRVQIERDRYAAHWLMLGQLSFADVLFLRIPAAKPM